MNIKVYVYELGYIGIICNFVLVCIVIYICVRVRHKMTYLCWRGVEFQQTNCKFSVFVYL